MKRMGNIAVIFSLLLILCSCGQPAEVLSWQEQYDLGVRYLSEGNYAKAIIAFTAAIEIDPKLTDAYIGRGNAYVGSGETDENLAAALADYEMAIGLDETNADAYLGLVDVYIRRGEYEKAMEILKETLDKTGADQSITDKLAELESGNVTDSSGNVRRRSGYDEHGALAWYHIFTYDGQGREASVTAFDAAGNQTGHVDLLYDEVGNQLTGYWWATDGEIGSNVYEYDGNGNVVKETHYESDG